MNLKKSISDKDVHLLIYENHVLIRKFRVFFGKYDSKNTCRRCLSSYSRQNVSIKHQQGYSQQEKTSVKTSNESHLYWKKYFHKKPISLRIYADFEVDSEIDNSNIGNETIYIYKQNPVRNGCFIKSELNDVHKSG